ncbi:TetR/AcrR family transcriptional regulator [Aquidulcibacter paucihalophilus]|uniref:TetR/AcrR family transcriptional regulator n=1 Tax=Aquidulcibacter paucihalophilus TaxID=1978549 RepID=UPI000A194BF7|nr:TetR/AcrR family transcriptional regulator [Aquidulcibacter paucihalophilus]
MAKQEDRRDETRKAILAAAKALFGTLGYYAVSIDQIAEDANVAKGAIYHYFSTKNLLFEAVLNDVGAAALKQLQAEIVWQEDALATMMAGYRAFFEICTISEFAQVFLRDGPAVLGWARWREIDTHYFGGMVKEGLKVAMDLDVLVRQPIDPLANLLIGAITEAAMDCAHSTDFKDRSDAYMTSLETILDGLKPTQ